MPYDTELLSEAFQLAWAGGCGHRPANQVKTRLRRFCRVFATSRPARRSSWLRVHRVPRVSPLYSQVAFRPQVSGIVFNTANYPEGFTGPALTPCPSRHKRRVLSRLSAAFFGRSLRRDSRHRLPVLIHSSNRYPLVTAIHPDPKLARAT
jgi:hypothetical protein